jgi:hypothetical protein
LLKPFQPARVFREKFLTLMVSYSLPFLKNNFPQRLLNNHLSEKLINHLFDHFVMYKINSNNNFVFINMLEKLFSIFNYGFRCFIVSKNSKQLETVQSKLPAIIENIFTNNKKHLRKLIHKHINFNNNYFNYINNQIIMKLIEQVKVEEINFIFIPKTIIISKTNFLYFRPQLILLSFTLNYIHSIKNKNYLLLRRTLEPTFSTAFRTSNSLC